MELARTRPTEGFPPLFLASSLTNFRHKKREPKLPFKLSYSCCKVLV